MKMMIDEWKATKQFFIISIILFLFNIALMYMGSPDSPMTTGFILFLLSPIILSFFFFLLTISFGIKSLKTGRKNSWYFIIISSLIVIIYILLFVLLIIDTKRYR